MKIAISLLMIVIGVGYALFVHADPSPLQAALQAAGQAAGQAAAGAATQTAITSLTSSGALVTLAALYSAYNLVMSGLQQIFSIGSKSTIPVIQRVSTVGLLVAKHLGSNPSV